MRGTRRGPRVAAVRVEEARLFLLRAARASRSSDAGRLSRRAAGRRIPCRTGVRRHVAAGATAHRGGGSCRPGFLTTGATALAGDGSSGTTGSHHASGAAGPRERSAAEWARTAATSSDQRERSQRRAGPHRAIHSGSGIGAALAWDIVARSHFPTKVIGFHPRSG